MSKSAFEQSNKFVGRRTVLKNGAGFTLLELMVVLVIFVLIASVILANYAGLRAARGLKIAQNELVTNLRKAQSYALSSRSIYATQAVQYYLLKFDTNAPDRYTMQAIYNVSTPPAQLADNVEVFRLPPGIVFGSSTAVSAFVIDRPPIGGFKDSYDTPPTDSSCVLVGYKLPFATTIFNNGCSPQTPSSNPYSISDIDDYGKMKNFVANSPSNSASNNSILTIGLMTSDKKLFKTVTVNGLTGGISFSQ